MKHWMAMAAAMAMLTIAPKAHAGDVGVRAAKAEKLHLMALKHAKKRRWKPAMELWDAAEELSPDWRFAFNLAASNAHLKRWPSAWNAIQRVRGHGVTAEQTPLVEELERKITKGMRKKHAWVAFKVEPADAKVTVKAIAWKPPYAQWIPKGVSRVRVSHPDYEPQEFKFSHPAGKRIERDIALKRSARKNPPGWKIINKAPTVSGHVAMPLSGGRVLLAGGERLVTRTVRKRVLTSLLATKDVWLFDTEKMSFTAARPMHQARVLHRAVTISDGRILVTGGRIRGDGGSYSSAEIYDPKDGTWAMAAPMVTARAAHTLVALGGGDALAIGGHSGRKLQSGLERFDAATETWRTVASKLSESISQPAALRLDNGSVLIAGGMLEGFTASDALYLFNPDTERVTRLKSPLKTARWSVMMTPLTDGRILMVGGRCKCAIRSDEIYDPRTGALSSISHPGMAPAGAGLVTLADGRALLVGGQYRRAGLDSSRAMAFSPLRGGTWTRLRSLNGRRSGHTTTRLPNGAILVVGGHGSKPKDLRDTAELLYP